MFKIIDIMWHCNVYLQQFNYDDVEAIMQKVISQWVGSMIHMDQLTKFVDIIMHNERDLVIWLFCNKYYSYI